MTIPSLVYVLLVAHFVGDFIAQSDWMALNKSKSWKVLAIHVTTYTAWLMVFAVMFLSIEGGLSPVKARALHVFLFVNAVAHFIQDAITSRITSRLWFLEITPLGETGEIVRDGVIRVEPVSVVRFKPTRHWFFVAIGADQLLHYVTLFATAEWLLLR